MLNFRAMLGRKKKTIPYYLSHSLPPHIGLGLDLWMDFVQTLRFFFFSYGIYKTILSYKIIFLVYQIWKEPVRILRQYDR
jgi:hypothetical protein